MQLFTIRKLFFAIFRRRRMKLFYAIFCPSAQTRLLDIGGAPQTWISESQHYPRFPVTLVNLRFPDPAVLSDGRFTAVDGDATDLPFPDQSFEIAFSNSVIEHLTTWERQQAFASHARRVAKKLWIQTPARHFPVEPHLLTPFYQYLPRHLQLRLARRFTLWGLLAKPNPAQVDEMVSELRLLTHREMRQLFPDCVILKERVLGITKSYVAVRGLRQRTRRGWRKSTALSSPKRAARSAVGSLFTTLQCALLTCCLRGQTPPKPPVTQASSSAPPTINVTDYGAKGDGSTDDTAAINAAMSACTARSAPKNGCTLSLPPGIYLTTGLTLRSFIHIRGDGWGTSVIQLKPHTRADVLTIPADTFNFSLHGLTLDGNAAHNSSSGGNCFFVAATPVGSAQWNTANKQTTAVNSQKWGHIEEVMFSNCTRDGIHIDAYNYMLFFDNFYAFHNGVYGVYTQGTNSGFSNFQIERNGTAGIHIANANNRFTSGEVIWNGGSNSSEAAVYVSGGRNILMAIETEDNFTGGFFDNGSDDEFIGCVSDTNGYAKGAARASSREASGFVLEGQGGIYIGDKVTSYRGRLPDGHFATEWPYTIRNPNQSKIDISYDSTNQPPRVLAENLPSQTASPSNSGRVACIKSAGPPPVLGVCSTKIDSSGSCKCI
jgi:Pectate lyase superfamily protein/Methyltransferase domain